jgi:hypothetical protein
VIDGTLCVTLFGSESVVITSIVVCCRVFPAELTLVWKIQWNVYINNSLR